ncbi:MAG: cytochrome c [Owenweeksia sp.]|nr:cytochrome c [Owenweeksia sp.]
MRKLSSILILTATLALQACGGGTADEPAEPKMQLQNNREAPAKADKKEASGSTDASSDAMTNKGVGPIKSLELAEIDQGLVASGEELFNKNCTACHKPEKRYIGPAIKGVTERRTPEWIMNMILNPTEMIKEDPLARQMVGEYNGAVMANQNLTEEQARAILEYFRTL